MFNDGLNSMALSSKCNFFFYAWPWAVDQSIISHNVITRDLITNKSSMRQQWSQPISQSVTNPNQKEKHIICLCYSISVEHTYIEKGDLFEFDFTKNQYFDKVGRPK